MTQTKFSIGIKAVPATKNSSASYEITIGEFATHRMEKPKFCENLKQELTTLLYNFYEYAQGQDKPKGFDIETVQDGWIAYPIK